MADDKGTVEKIATGAVEALAEVATTNGRKRRLNGTGFVLLCLSLALTVYLVWGKVKDAGEWKTATDSRLQRIEVKVDALLLMNRIDPARVASAGTPTPTSAAPSPWTFNLLQDASAATPPAVLRKP